jgi:RNA polymerase sigma-70 factor (ECF subfamily)
MTDTIRDESALIARLRAGDQTAYAELVQAHSSRIYHLALRMVGDEATAEDILQETFLNAFRAIEHFEGRSSLGTWLYRIALNTAIRHAGKAARESSHRAEADPEHPDSIAALPADPDEAPDHLVWQRIRHEALRDAVHQLPDKHREVIVLHFFEGKTCEEIAEILETNIGTVWSRVHYAVKKLRAQLEGIASG